MSTHCHEHTLHDFPGTQVADMNMGNGSMGNRTSSGAVAAWMPATNAPFSQMKTLHSNNTCTVVANFICTAAQNQGPCVAKGIASTACICIFSHCSVPTATPNYGTIIFRVGQPKPYIYTVYDRIFGDFPAKNTVYTPYIYGSGQP